MMYDRQRRVLQEVLLCLQNCQNSLLNEGPEGASKNKLVL